MVNMSLISFLMKVYNDVLGNMADKAQTQLKDLKKDVQEVNWARKNQQGLVGDRLKQLESHWVGLVSKNYEIEQALAKMEEEIATLPTSDDYFKAKRKKEEESENVNVNGNANTNHAMQINS